MVEFIVPAYVKDPEDAPQAVNDLARATSFVVQQVNDLPTTPARLVTATLTTTASPVAHNLGYIYRGVVVVKKTASVDVYEDSAASNIDPRKYAMLRTASGTQTVTLMFF